MDGPLIMVVALGGSAAACAAAVVIARILRLDVLLVGRRVRPPEPTGLIEQIVELADLARREGLMSAERRAAAMGDSILLAGIGMAVEGSPPERIEGALVDDDGLAGGGRRLSRLRGVAVRYPQAGVFAGGAMVIALLAASGFDPAGIGQPFAAAALGLFVAGALAMSKAGAVAAIGGREVARAMLDGMIRARGVAMIREGRDAAAVRAELVGMLPPSSRPAAVRAEAA